MSLQDTTINDLAETFEVLDDWEERYRFILDLGKDLSPLQPSEMIDSNRVHGCQASVWLVPAHCGDTMTFRADSDAHIVKGLIAMLIVIYSGQTVDHILKFDIEGFFHQMELREHISSTRNNGLHAMIMKIKALASGKADTDTEQSIELS